MKHDACAKNLVFFRVCVRVMRSRVSGKDVTPQVGDEDVAARRAAKEDELKAAFAPTGVYAHQVRGFLKASIASASGEPGAGLWSYWNSQYLGRDMRMDSMRPPVFKPKVVPRS